MQCPNCGRESININGREICLDCGIEIAHLSPQNFSNKQIQSSEPSLEAAKAGLSEPVIEPDPKQNFSAIDQNPVSAVESENDYGTEKTASLEEVSVPVQTLPGENIIPEIEESIVPNAEIKNPSFIPSNIPNTVEEEKAESNPDTNLLDPKVEDLGDTKELPQPVQKSQDIGVVNNFEKEGRPAEEEQIEKLLGAELPKDFSINKPEETQSNKPLEINSIIEDEKRDSGQNVPITAVMEKSEAPALNLSNPGSDSLSDIEAKPISEIVADSPLYQNDEEETFSYAPEPKNINGSEKKLSSAPTAPNQNIFSNNVAVDSIVFGNVNMSQDRPNPSASFSQSSDQGNLDFQPANRVTPKALKKVIVTLLVVFLLIAVIISGIYFYKSSITPILKGDEVPAEVVE